MEPERRVVYARQTQLDRAIELYKNNLQKQSKLQEDPKRWTQFILKERNKIKTIASIQRGLEKYRNNIARMNVEDREDEKHEPRRLGDHMRAEGLARPGMHWHAHAIV
jgi:Na+/phosphate symporter